MTTRKQNTTAAPAEAEAATKNYVVSGVKVEDSTPVKYVANPKRQNSAAWERYEKYQGASTWAEYKELNSSKFMMADARHDFSKGFLKIGAEK
jgi:hypothetical protein